MGTIEKPVTTGEFSKITGLAVSTITKMLRQKKLSGEKRKGKWAIYESDLHQYRNADNKNKKQVSDTNIPAEDTSPALADTHTIENFVQMTYLTEQGVRQWLKTGRLIGSLDPDGSGRVAGENLARPDLKHLIR